MVNGRTGNIMREKKASENRRLKTHMGKNFMLIVAWRGQWLGVHLSCEVHVSSTFLTRGGGFGQREAHDMVKGIRNK